MIYLMVCCTLTSVMLHVGDLAHQQKVTDVTVFIMLVEHVCGINTVLSALPEHLRSCHEGGISRCVVL